MKSGEKVFTLVKAFTIRQGLTRKDDDWPDRFYVEPLPDGPAKGAILSRDETKRLLELWKSEITNNLDDYKIENKRAFGVLLESILKERGFKLSGNYPFLKTGLYSIELDFEKAVAMIWYGPKEELMGTSKLSVEALANQLQKFDKSFL